MAVVAKPAWLVELETCTVTSFGEVVVTCWC
ncbi:Uncharacterised protein [Mycobacterium tuberculosis]|uniref:Uncharacterized protein n=1 Tax=Mycobacterium tuberculosis TaxID=1773 RepID=A0A654ZSI1_MYCTX|nr:Uncharacterised protein [Mycobacterium tuberculosis]CKT42408.1 Uncharacterised protein [Mycobacterium tuberculosis]